MRSELTTKPLCPQPLAARPHAADRLAAGRLHGRNMSIDDRQPLALHVCYPSRPSPGAFMLDPSLTPSRAAAQSTTVTDADTLSPVCLTTSVSQQCSSIDHILHTLDQTSQVLTSSKLFPSRSVPPSASFSHQHCFNVRPRRVSISPSSRRQLEAVTRRVARFFGHAYHHHPEVFEACEVSLCNTDDARRRGRNLAAAETDPSPTMDTSCRERPSSAPG
jgi:hypothetical protein